MIILHWSKSKMSRPPIVSDDCTRYMNIVHVSMVRWDKFHKRQQLFCSGICPYCQTVSLVQFFCLFILPMSDGSSVFVCWNIQPYFVWPGLPKQPLPHPLSTSPAAEEPLSLSLYFSIKLSKISDKCLVLVMGTSEKVCQKLFFIFFVFQRTSVAQVGSSVGRGLRPVDGRWRLVLEDRE